MSKEDEEMRFWRARYAEEKSFSVPACTQSMLRKYNDLLMIDERAFIDKTVVDIGCGPRGTLHEYIAREKIGIDPLADTYQKEFLLKHDIRYINAPAEKIPLPDGYADYVLSVNSLDHVDDVHQALREIERILSPMGIFLACINIDAHGAAEPHVFKEDQLGPLLEPHFRWSVLQEIPKGKDVPFKRISIRCLKW